ncbi:hypothetical protein SDC9_190071 [bioreactor metagenome]|uniref:Uncharacterized protein n=1 Tax=bioreactor metagenome TaxID=1076179 RepID=A0A645I222_9ZZZZ
MSAVSSGGRASRARRCSRKSSRSALRRSHRMVPSGEGLEFRHGLRRDEVHGGSPVQEGADLPQAHGTSSDREDGSRSRGEADHEGEVPGPLLSHRPVPPCRRRESSRASGRGGPIRRRRGRGGLSPRSIPCGGGIPGRRRSSGR